MLSKLKDAVFAAGRAIAGRAVGARNWVTHVVSTIATRVATGVAEASAWLGFGPKTSVVIGTVAGVVVGFAAIGAVGIAAWYAVVVPTVWLWPGVLHNQVGAFTLLTAAAAIAWMVELVLYVPFVDKIVIAVDAIKGAVKALVSRAAGQAAEAAGA
jgi:hypothetical protein